jgi:hypothetical protein
MKEPFELRNALVADKNAIASQKKSLPQGFREKCRPQLSCLHHCKSKKAKTIIRIQGQTWREKGLQYVLWEGISQHERKVKVCLNW